MSVILNNAMKQISPESDPYTVAAEFLEKLFYLIPSYGGFNIQDVINDSDLTIHQKITADYLSSEIKNILQDDGCLESVSKFGNLTLQLNSYGREVKNSGGLFAYKAQILEFKNESNITNILKGNNYDQFVPSRNQFNFFNLEPNVSTSLPKVDTTPNTIWSDLKGKISKHLTELIIGIIITVTGGFILFKLGWLS